MLSLLKFYYIKNMHFLIDCFLFLCSSILFYRRYYFVSLILMIGIEEAEISLHSLFWIILFWFYCINDLFSDLLPTVSKRKLKFTKIWCNDKAYWEFCGEKVLPSELVMRQINPFHGNKSWVVDLSPTWATLQPKLKK